MRISIAQMDVKPFDLNGNFDKMCQMTLDAKKHKADLVAFPELCITGYMVGDAWNDPEFVSRVESANFHVSHLAAETGIIIVFGNVVTKPGVNEDGRQRKYNGAIIAWPDGTIDYRFKTLLPNYRFFDDKRYFSSNEEIRLVEKHPWHFGVTICEDVWNADYNLDPVGSLMDYGADFILNLSSSPFSVNKWEARDHAIAKHYKQKRVPFIYVNCVGVQNNGKNIVTFDGDSRFYDENGNKVDYCLPPYQEGLLTMEIIGSTLQHKFVPPWTPSSPIVQKELAILEAIRHHENWLGFSPDKWVIGLSGGIDSSLSACLLVKALGKDKVLGVGLPSKYNSDKTKDNARKLAEALGIEYRVVPIQEFVDAFKNSIPGLESGINEENLQARIRGQVLLSIASTV
jgi:NAD+ synthase (glutamine-hydrolysing)